jgi:hypothetical protein
MLRYSSVVSLAWLISCWSMHSRAALSEVPSEPPMAPRLSLNVALFAGVSFGLQCHASGNDTSDCLDNSGTAGLRLAPRWRVSSHLGLGVSSGVASVTGNSSFAVTRWWDEQLGARYYIGTPSASQWWLDGTLGVLIAREHTPAYQTQIGGMMSEHTATDWAPAASLALGHDIELVRYFGLAPELRVSFYGLDIHYKGMHPAYNPQTVVTLGVNIIGLGCYR